jgi:hypothetical protein
MPIAQAWKAFDKQGTPTDAQLTEQLHALGREVARDLASLRSNRRRKPTRPKRNAEI